MEMWIQVTIEESKAGVINEIILSMITICEVFYNFLLILIFTYYYQSVYYLVHQIATQKKETRTQDVGILLGPKPLPLREENPHKNSSYRDSN